jgi:hypothetical protein
MTNVIVLQKFYIPTKLLTPRQYGGWHAPGQSVEATPVSDVFYVDELIAKGLGFALQIRQHPIAILLCIRLLSRVNVGSTISQQ